ncbi:hypothetical protein TIFTF001_000563 [Ficus carica]|uniref:Uncharacterized protein n=1 Tax=Ficus carica TaxID=3494 RepID=A0AA88CK65_FICCA|nr:hypothetical protein TIFTF001_000563 [Ficus carica]
MKFFLSLEPSTGREKPVVRRQSAAPVADKARQHLPTVIVRALCVEIIYELRHRRALIIGIELKIDVVYQVSVFSPQGQPSDTLGESVGIGAEVLVVDVDSVEVVVFDDTCERRNRVGNPRVDREGLK